MKYFAAILFFTCFALNPVLSENKKPAAAEEKKMQDPDVFPEAVKRTNPVYPEEARKEGIEGTVYIEATISAEGKVEKAVVKRGVRADIDQAAVTCLKQWEFKPGTVKGKPVKVDIVVPFRFKLAK